MNIQRKKQALEKIARILDKTLQVVPQAELPCKYALAIKEQRQLRIFFLSKKKRSTIGRRLENDIHLKSPGVSRYHATLYRWQDSFWIFDGVGKDRPSKNGISVNHRRCQNRQLKHGDVITFDENTRALFLQLPAEATPQSEIQLIQQALGLYLNNPHPPQAAAVH